MKRLKILLISPKSYDDQFDQKMSEYRLFPFSVVYIVNYLKKMDISDIDFVDFVMESQESVWKKIEHNSYDIIGFTSTTEARFLTLKAIRHVKSISPKSQIVVGGYFFSNVAEETLQKNLEIDYVVKNEGEVTFSELVKYLSGFDVPIEGILGLVYRRGTEIISNPPRPPESHIDKFQIDYDLVSKEGYSFLFPLKNWEDDPTKMAFPIMLGRGCNQRCIFCMFRYISYRVSSLQSILKQIDWVKEKLNAKYFMFSDPSFTERKKFVAELCNALIQGNYQIQWYCETRADTPVSLLKLMRRAGCISVDFALESGSDKVLSAIKKKMTLSKIKDFASACYKLGIRASYFSMVSMPEEKLEDVDATLDAMQLLSQYNMGTAMAPMLIYPGTDLFTMAKEKGMLPKDFSWFDESYKCQYKFISPREYSVPHYLEHLTEQQVVESLERARLLGLKNNLKEYFKTKPADYIRRRFFQRLFSPSSYTNIKDLKILFAYINHYISLCKPYIEPLLKSATAIRQKIKESVNTQLMQAPYRTDVYANFIKSIITDKQCCIQPYDCLYQLEKGKKNFFVRHDITTRQCIENMSALLDIDVAHNVRAGVFVRVDGDGYSLKDFRESILFYKDKGIEFGLYTSCYLGDDYLNKFLEETKTFEEVLGFSPESFVVHDAGPFKNDMRKRFIEEVTDSIYDRGYFFTDSSEKFVLYDYVIKDNHTEVESKKEFIKKEFLKVGSPVKNGRCCLILTHPMCWTAETSSAVRAAAA